MVTTWLVLLGELAENLNKAGPSSYSMDSRPGATAPAFWNGSEERPEAQRFRSLLGAIDTAVFNLDADGYVLGANTALSDATSHPVEELRGAHVSPITTEEPIEQISRESGSIDGDGVVEYEAESQSVESTDTMEI